MANAPLPPEPACDARHFGQCLRVMLAVLPKRSQDELSGELFVAAYQRKLGHLSNAAISHIADTAMEKCHWFPTIAECLTFMETYRRDDDWLALRIQAYRIEHKESQARVFDRLAVQKLQNKPLTQDDVAVMPEPLRRIGLANGWLVTGLDGEPILPLDPECDGDMQY